LISVKNIRVQGLHGAKDLSEKMHKLLELSIRDRSIREAGIFVVGKKFEGGCVHLYNP
jgi:hypothetical protein